MPWWAWVAIGWVSLAAVVGLVVGRVIRNRDRQIPTGKPPDNETMQRLYSEQQAESDVPRP